MLTIRRGLVILAFTALAGPAWAEPPTTGVAGGDPTRGHLLTEHGMAATVGAGATNFFDRHTRDLLDGDVGGYADLRVT